jgi:predicted enzyme related to lactoylglutathione lyase
MSDTPTGRFCWYELMTTDPEAAPAFYGAVAGWGAQAWEGGADPYTMWMNGESPIGGIMKLPEEAAAAGAPSHWMIYISTPDVAATAKKAEELGGIVVMGPMELPEVGTICVISDPHGAVFCAFQPATYTPGHDGPPAMGEFSWHELATADWEAGWSFYAELFDWQKDEAMDMGEMGTYQMFNRGAHPLGGVFNKPDSLPVSCWMPYVRVPDVDAAARTVAEMGGQVLNGPMDVPGGDRVAQCADPAGAAFAIHSLPASDA